MFTDVFKVFRFVPLKLHEGLGYARLNYLHSLSRIWLNWFYSTRTNAETGFFYDNTASEPLTLVKNPVSLLFMPKSCLRWRSMLGSKVDRPQALNTGKNLVRLQLNVFGSRSV